MRTWGLFREMFGLDKSNAERRHVHIFWRFEHWDADFISRRYFGAGNEVRTRDLNLGKVALYQLSYTRIKTRVLRSSCIIDQY